MLLVVMRAIILISDASPTIVTGTCLKDQNRLDMFNPLVMKLARIINILPFKLMDGVFVEMRMQLHLNMYKNPTVNAEALKV